MKASMCVASMSVPVHPEIRGAGARYLVRRLRGSISHHVMLSVAKMLSAGKSDSTLEESWHGVVSIDQRI